MIRPHNGLGPVPTTRELPSNKGTSVRPTDCWWRWIGLSANPKPPHGASWCGNIAGLSSYLQPCCCRRCSWQDGSSRARLPSDVPPPISLRIVTTDCPQVAEDSSEMASVLERAGDIHYSLPCSSLMCCSSKSLGASPAFPVGAISPV
jgi:hypothetical protein